jgi:hypothetical protein
VSVLFTPGCVSLCGHRRRCYRLIHRWRRPDTRGDTLCAPVPLSGAAMPSSGVGRLHCCGLSKPDMMLVSSALLYRAPSSRAVVPSLV